MCTGIRFTDDQGNLYFGRNLDWTSDWGERVVVTPRGWGWTSPLLGAVRTRHAVIGMGIVAHGMPLYFDCANEAGLAVAGLNFPGYAAFESAAVPGKTCVAAYEFPLWLAATFSTVDEVVTALATTAIVGRPLSDDLAVAELHWLVADASRSVVVEYTARGMEVFDNGFDVLTNPPGFDFHRENARLYMALDPAFPQSLSWRGAELSSISSGTGIHGLPGDYTPPSRFVRAAYLNAHYPQKAGEAANVTRLFRTLGGTAMIDGAAAMANGQFERTLYTGGYSALTKTYYYSTYDDPAVRAVALTEEAASGTELVQL